MGYHHTKGQRHGSRGIYKPPHGLLDELLTWSSDGMKRNARENKEYDEGYKNGRKNRR
jgi:hypothetical protein